MNVCRYWYRACSSLYRHIVLHRVSQCSALLRTLLENPTLTSYVEELNVYCFAVPRDTTIFTTSVRKIVQICPRLRRFARKISYIRMSPHDDSWKAPLIGGVSASLTDLDLPVFQFFDLLALSDNNMDQNLRALTLHSVSEDYISVMEMHKIIPVSLSHLKTLDCWDIDRHEILLDIPQWNLPSLDTLSWPATYSEAVLKSHGSHLLVLKAAYFKPETFWKLLSVHAPRLQHLFIPGDVPVRVLANASHPTIEYLDMERKKAISNSNSKGAEHSKGLPKLKTVRAIQRHLVSNIHQVLPPGGSIGRYRYMGVDIHVEADRVYRADMGYILKYVPGLV
ncbi:hypothetical protein BT96DRAFT_471932 [Gymnopus androsaceus JB14]|uniref:F-box domain-containing protein n=1 Tax=Gymnopus androsaceus JB14 TaxID=1447944 RepID=A0A6A4II83_9AGAR|nr:hypothetical protein BT96DRAFT_471932 [Gymnopus androsaceus JB14]